LNVLKTGCFLAAGFFILGKARDLAKQKNTNV